MNSMNNLILLIPLLPLIGFLINGTIALQKARNKLNTGTTTIALTACIMPLIAFVLSILVFLNLLNNPNGSEITTGNLLDWIVVENLSVTFGFVVDHLSVIMLLIVTGVGTLIHFYSIGYMKEDEGFAKYMAYLNLFLFFMLVLILGDSLLLLFVGWEGVGLCSYLLIGFWFTDTAKAQAGKKAFIVNRIGDFAFMIGMFTIVAVFTQIIGQVDDGVLNFPKNFLSFEFLRNNAQGLAPMATVITLCLFIGATGKSAQIPLYVWLPDAMAGPTPVSALIHAATMVTAGIYMIARMHFLFVMAPVTMNIIATIGLLTAFFAALIGITQYDIKKVLAYSTVSQLGFMFLALGVGAFSSAIFHVMTHAFFKACLFLGAGSVIHGLHHEQDVRFMGGLLKKMPITAITFLICTLAISGIPPLSGFFSKDEILYMTYANAPHRMYFWLGLLTAGITSFYMMRLFALTFLGATRNPHPDHIHESPAVMTTPLIILAVLAAVSGLVGLPGNSWINGWLHQLGQHIPHHIENSVLQEYHLMGISIGWAALCSLTAFIIFTKKLTFAENCKHQFGGLYRLVYNKFRIDELYNGVIVQPIKSISDVLLFRFVDKTIIDGLILGGLAGSSRFVGRCLSVLQTGLLGHYLIYFIAGLMLILFLVIQ